MRNKQSRIFLVGVFSLLLSGITTVSYSYDVIRSKQFMENADKQPPATTKTTENKTSTNKPGATPSECVCSKGVQIDSSNPGSGYIYHCQCGNLECAVTQYNQSHPMPKMSRPPLSCK